MCIFALSLCQTLCLHGKCHAFRLISLAAWKIRFSPLPLVFAHWHIFPSIALSLYRISNASVHLGPFGCVQRNVFFCQIHTPTHRTGSRCGPNLCLPFISVNSTSYFLAFSPPSFPHCHHICSIFLFQLSFFGSKRRMTKTQTEKQRIVQAEIVGLVHSQCCSNIKVSPPATDSVRRGSA